MKIKKVLIRNFRRLEDVQIDFEESDTVFVGPNNSGKTSATTAFKLFLEKQEFKIHDFTVSKIAQINSFGESRLSGEEPEADEESPGLPSIEFDIWFSIDPGTEYGRIAAISPTFLTDFEEVGMRISLSVVDDKKLIAEYTKTFPPNEEPNETEEQKEGADTQPDEQNVSPKSLSHFLSMPGVLGKHFKLKYFSLENTEDGIKATAIDPNEGKAAIKSLICVDFVDAQRNIDDQEVGRSNRLSAAFAAFYKMNLEQAETSEEANRIVDQNNESLTTHYETHFQSLMGVIKGLGVPAVNDRDMKIRSTLSPEVALKGNTELLYVDSNLSHELPEAYNGLGFKNLVYMAIQINHFHLQWMNTPEKRPLCQVIFVEEPEVHLHAQVQQTFVSNIWKIIEKASVENNEAEMVPQLCVTTHSTHILDAVDFQKARYFKRRCLNDEDENQVQILNASTVLNLNDFNPTKEFASGEVENPGETIKFLDKYLKLTHCDLFFADGAILVEGAAEKLLLPRMIEKSAPELLTNYLTILEVGGAYAHRFASLMEFLGVPFLVITDIDSVAPDNNGSACQANQPDAVTSNGALKDFLNLSTITDLSHLASENQSLFNDTCFVAYQKPTPVPGYTEGAAMHGRTFEEAFIYENINLIRSGDIPIGKNLADPPDFDQDHQTCYDRVKSSTFKKTDFALDVASSEANWKTPQYIAEGLEWFKSKTAPNPLIAEQDQD